MERALWQMGLGSWGGLGLSSLRDFHCKALSGLLTSLKELLILHVRVSACMQLWEHVCEGAQEEAVSPLDLEQKTAVSHHTECWEQSLGHLEGQVVLCLFVCFIYYLFILR